MTVTAIEARPVAPALGAECTGVDLNHVDDRHLAVMRELLLEHLVLFFPDQRLTLDEHVALGRRFGELEVHPNLPTASPDHPEVVELRASHGGTADEWHSDVTFLPNPSVMSVLNMVECPDVGGDTMWANQYLAFESLSPPVQEMLAGMTALHDAQPHGKPEMESIHPVVRTHPETGRRSLLVNEHFTRRLVEVSHDESRALLAFLTAWSVRPEFSVRHRWTAGTVAMWDNRCTQHCVVNDFEGERIIQRVTVLGDEPEGEAPRWDPAVLSSRGAKSVHDIKLRRHLGGRADGHDPRSTTS